METEIVQTQGRIGFGFFRISIGQFIGINNGDGSLANHLNVAILLK